jgi:hypothetical protein
LRQAQAVLRLHESHGAARLERACQRALEAGDGRFRTVRGILERHLEEALTEELPSGSGEPHATRTRAFLRGPDAFRPVEGRPAERERERVEVAG